MQSSNEGLTFVPGSDTDSVNELTQVGQAPAVIRGRCLLFEHENRYPLFRIMLYSPFAIIHSATALPMAAPESSWMKCDPGTVTSLWLFQRRQNSRGAPIRMAPGSALTNSFGMSFCAIHCE